MANMSDALGDSSEDEFPEVDVVVRQYRHKVKGRQPEGDRDDEEFSSRNVTKTTSQKRSEVTNTPAVKATPLRRRKLGQTQTTDQSLLKPWGKTVSSKEEKSRAPNSRGHRATVQVKGEIIELDSSSKVVPELMSSRARQHDHHGVSSSTDSKPISIKAEKLQRDGNRKASNINTRPVPKKLPKSSLLSNVSGEESDMFEDIQESSEEVSEFVSESDSETDAWNSGSEHSVTPRTRRSRSPTIQWANPQRTLFKSPDKKAAPSNKQPQATIDDLTKRPPKQRGTLKTLKASQSGGNLEDVFQKLQIFNEDSEPDEPSVKRNQKPILEPTTPRKTLKTVPASPLKTPKIPASPWKPEHKEFWDSEAHFGWIDKHSPEKKPESPKKAEAKPTAQELKAEAKRKYGTSPEKKKARMAFDAVKEELARSFLQELDDRITDGKLSRLTEDTGGLRITWSNALLSTAGRAHWKCKTQSTTTKNADGVQTSRHETREHTGTIELSSKVLCNEHDLLNTVAHEFCHLAVFILNGKPKAPHGAEFKALGARCGRAFADRGIVVTTKHNYEIEYKYVWECEGCRAQIRRHSRSIDPGTQRCGTCRGALRQVKPTPRGGGGGASTPTNGVEGSSSGGPATAKKKPSAWHEFLSQEMKALGQSKPGMSFKEKMAVASAKWKERERTIKELRTAVEVLKIEDGDQDEVEVKQEEDGAAKDQPNA
ncbi:SprT-like family-domain-containing protein [Annulohypoxylon truncatum]|uniref:SprT-like family-domain-containing protein n=1 Tax=Annulohypoxylon truncatum TaxID=327061 RepID=UPI002008D66F|nr:SprT-like family-domain-containing protein [Annulohypoxylon truncatum]KAI1207771.1 SprT-like family-domain-containing protein [Annulohypoxylon truncatum]